MKSILIAVCCGLIGLYAVLGTAGVLAGLKLACQIERRWME